ncbi:MAG TPA: hypothetical protein VKZ53_13015 [Candidatus Angelobacter sp.]|nr:hypothetical protein [Candidatus Angelobacter sp.]
MIFFSSGIFYYLYWSTALIGEVFIIFVLRETFADVFSAFYVLKWFRRLVTSVTLVSLAYAIARGFIHPAYQANSLGKLVFSAEIGMQIIQAALIILFIWLWRFYRVEWDAPSFGIVAGFAFAISGSLVAYMLRSDFGTKLNLITKYSGSVSYIVAIVIWHISFLGKQSVFAPRPVADSLDELKRYSTVLRKVR